MVVDGSFDLHFKQLQGDALLGILIGRSTPEWPDWTADNVFSCKDTLDLTQDVLGAFCKGGDISSALIEKR